MSLFTLSQLRDVADQLTHLSSIFQTRPNYLRAKQIRQADKALVLLEVFFTPELTIEAHQWKTAMNGLNVLLKKRMLLEKQKKEIEEIQEQILQKSNDSKSWLTLDSTEKIKIQQHAKKVITFLRNQNQEFESQIIYRYNRYISLKALVPYADNASYLSEAVFHFENKEKYIFSICKLDKKLGECQQKNKSVQRGFWFAVFFCGLLVTIPICLPFAISLWKRKNYLETQIETIEESLKREKKRLQAAEEGSLITKQIRDILGDISLEETRETLIEIKDLRTEFQGPERIINPASSILSYIDSNNEKITELFGAIPDEFSFIFKWFIENLEQQEKRELDIQYLQEKLEDLKHQQSFSIKGYSSEILESSIEKLQQVVDTQFRFLFDNGSKSFFVDVCTQAPALLSQIREALYYVSKGKTVDLGYWNLIRMKAQGMTNLMSLCVLDSEINDAFVSDEHKESKEKEYALG